MHRNELRDNFGALSDKPRVFALTDAFYDFGNTKTMNSLVFPNVTSNPTGTETFDLDDSDDIAGLAKQLIDGRHIGVLTTVDESGFPHARWMATLACDDFPRIVTLTSPKSRKVDHIRHNPYVNWMFSNQDLTLILNLAGRATVLNDTRSIKRSWKAVKDKSHACFLNNYSDKPGIAVIETVVERIDCSIPKSGFQLSKTVLLVDEKEKPA